jgi:hypothetical protein
LVRVALIAGPPTHRTHSTYEVPFPTMLPYVVAMLDASPLNHTTIVRELAPISTVLKGGVIQDVHIWGRSGLIAMDCRRLNELEPAHGLLVN